MTKLKPILAALRWLKKREPLGEKHVGGLENLVRAAQLAPDTTITTKPPTSAAGSASFAFTATPSGSFECKLDAQAYAACTSPTSYTVAAGSHNAEGSFSTSATSRSGGPRSANRQIRVGEGMVTKASTTAGTQGAWSVNVTGLAAGAHTLRAYAVSLLSTSDGPNPVLVQIRRHVSPPSLRSLHHPAA
jgi:hypothetical protein